MNIEEREEHLRKLAKHKEEEWRHREESAGREEIDNGGGRSRETRYTYERQEKTNLKGPATAEVHMTAAEDEKL